MFLVWTGYEMGSSPPGAYTTSKTSLVENIKHGWKINTVANTTTLFAREILQRSSFPGNPNPQTRKPPSENSSSRLRFPCLLLLTPPRPPHQPSPQTTLSWAETLDWPVHFFAVVETWRSTHVSLLHSVIWTKWQENAFIRGSMENACKTPSYVFGVWEGCNLQGNQYMYIFLHKRQGKKQVERVSLECNMCLGLGWKWSAVLVELWPPFQTL